MNKKILTSLLIIGVVGTLAAGSTFALFNDTETSDNNLFRAGAFDLKVDWTESYNGEVVEEQNFTDNPGAIFNISDVKPGDEGEATISLHLFNNPGYIRMNVTQTANYENGCTEPEAEVDDSCGNPGSGEGELGENLYFTIWQDDGDNVLEEGEELVFNGTAEELSAGPNETETDKMNGSEEEVPEVIPNSTTQYIGVKWWVPIEVGNEIQTDSKQFRFDFEAVQARHNPNGSFSDGEEEEDGEGKQVTICHIPPGNPDNPQTITVGKSALAAHLAHGDTQGECPEEEEEVYDYYQVDLYSGDVVENLSDLDNLISSPETEAELQHYVHGNVNDSITTNVEKGQVKCVASSSASSNNGDIVFDFTVKNKTKCGSVRLTAASYTKPYPGYIFNRRGEQVLYDYVTDNYGPGDHQAVVDVPN